ncbi:MAG: sodium:solute symporter family protein [Candidatus Gracilibacteria bacterium]|nr:sodium:solute symporter family protein [Candidatus Gracilibacteria bacterium]
MNGLWTIDNIIIIIYLLFTLGLGIYVGRGVKNFKEYSVANRNFGAFIIFATLSASFIGGGFTTGIAGKVYLTGVAAIVALLGFSLKEIIVAKVIAPRTKNFKNILSVGDIMETNYGKTGKIITGIFSVLLCAGILGAQVGAIGAIFNIFLGIEPLYGILIGTGIVIIYDTVGGMKSVVLTDVIQFITLAIGIPLTFIFGLMHVGGWDSLVTKVPSSYFDFSSLFSGLNLVAFISLFLTFLLGETLVPPYVRRLFISKDSKTTEKGTFWSGIFSIPFFIIAGLIGLIAFAIDPSLESSNTALPFTINTVLPIGLKGIVVAGMIAVVMSSADSFLNSASVAFVNDILKPVSKKDHGEKKLLLFARLSTFITGALAILFAVKIEKILDILIYAYNFWAPIILVPLAATILGYKSNLKIFLGSSFAGLGAVLVWTYALSNPYGFDGLIVGIFANLLVFSIMTKFCKIK